MKKREQQQLSKSLGKARYDLGELNRMLAGLMLEAAPGRNGLGASRYLTLMGLRSQIGGCSGHLNAAWEIVEPPIDPAYVVKL